MQHVPLSLLCHMSLSIMLLSQFYVTHNHKTYFDLQVKWLITLVNNFQLFRQLIQVCWEQKWQARPRNSYRFCVLPYVVSPPDGTCVALAHPSQYHSTMKNESQLDTTETEFLIARRQPILWLFSLQSGSIPMTGTKGEWQGRKGKKKGKDKREAKAIWERNATYSMCEGDLPWNHKNLWQHVIYWGSKGLQRIKNIFDAWKTARTTYSKHKMVIFILVNNFQLFSDNMDEISCIFTKSGMLTMLMTHKILYTTYRFYVLQICHKFMKINYSRIYVQGIQGSLSRKHRSQAWKMVRKAYRIHKLIFLIIW